MTSTKPVKKKIKIVYIRLEPELHQEIVDLLKRKKKTINTWARYALISQLNRDKQ